MTERLDRIEALVEKNSEAIATATNERQELREVFLATMRVVAESSQRQDEQAQAQTEILRTISDMQQQVTEMQSEVRGLQVENRRILDRVFGGDA